MLSFVYAANLLQAFIFWELVGLASFLLIGFWYQKPTAVAAAKKAFIMTRIGDVGLFIGLIFLLTDAGTLDITVINQPETVSSSRPAGSISSRCSCSWASSARAHSSRFTPGCPTPWRAPRP